MTQHAHSLKLWLAVACLLTWPSAASVLEARPRFKPVRIKNGDTLFAPGVTGLGAYPRLNDRNQVVFTLFMGGKFTAQLWDNGRLHPAGDQSSYSRVLARGLNDSGQVVGEAQFQVNGDHIHGFVSTLHSFGLYSINPQAHFNDTTCLGVTVYDINEQGVASGWGSYAVTPGFAFYRPIVWQGGSVIESGTIGAHPADSQDFHWPVLINNSGIIAGTVSLFYSGHFSNYRGYYGPPGSVSEVEPFAGGTSVYIWDINDQGLLAGQSDGSWGSYHAILVNGGQKKDIHGTVFAPTTYSVAYAVNDSGVAVGWWLGGRGLYHANDTTWLIDSLLATRRFPDGASVRLFEALDVNNQGVVLALYEGPGGFGYPCLLVPVDSGTIVNTDNDLPDLNPNDGRCYTGNVTALGEDECSLRAAIQHANAHAAVDTVRFRIPGAGVPLIKVNSSLPVITEAVLIDAVTQPGSRRVEVVPATSLTGGDGLVVTADSCTLRGLLINRFAGSGLVLDAADLCRIELCHFGVGPDSTTPAGNGTAGVFIQNTSGTRLGDSFEDEANLIAHNGGPGVLVASGFYNDVSFNYIFRNGGLGIDLFPLGVTKDDPLDADAGANDLTNYPYFDSVKTAKDSTRVFGTMPAGNSSTYTIRLYRSDTCDTSGYGEGQRPVAFQFVSTPAPEERSFQLFFPDSLLPGEVLTMTATGTGGNTSEFSACWPAAKWLHLVDGKGAPIGNRIFTLSRVANDPPVFTETLLDTVTSDAQGRVNAQPYCQAGQLHHGDTIKVAKMLDYLPRYKAGPPVTERSLTTYLDNGRFDSLDYHFYFDELDREPDQVVKLTHTTMGVNLVISVEWEADGAYFQSMQTGLRDLSNYLYDVFDGQVRLDTVFLYNSGELWKYADVQVKASNTLRPHADRRGLYAMGAFLHFCRRWHNAPAHIAVERSLMEWPMQPDQIDHWRTIGHELGHYLFGFADEYFEDHARRCAPFHFYGFMDSQYPTHEPKASEMSWDEQYADPVCQNTGQYLLNRKPCWDQWETEFQNEYNGVYADILRPSERLVPGTQEFFFGPNDWNAPLQYDVGRLVEFRYQVGLRTTVDKRVYFKGPRGALSWIDVSLWQASTGRKIEQGHTASNGGIRVLGGATGDSLIAAGGKIRQPFQRAALAADSDYLWSSVIQPWVAGPGDSVDVVAMEVAGYLPANVRMDVGSADASLSLSYLYPFDLSPSLQFWADPDSGTSTLLPTSDVSGAYQVTLPLSAGYSGSALVRAVDTAGIPFVFGVDLVLREVSTGSGVRVNSADGASYLDIDSLTQDGRVSVATSGYLPLRSGLDARARQLGTTASISAHPLDMFDSAQLVLTYEESGLSDAEPPFDQEASVRLYAWHEAGGQWTLLGGAVDTQANFVSAKIPGPGLYAAFTTGQVVDVENDGHGEIRPDDYELGQNYPNPFNPTTVISYYLPRPGRATVRIHNVLGQTVRTLVNELQVAGRHECTWDGRDASGGAVGSGVYFYTLRSGDVELSRRMVLIR